MMKPFRLILNHCRFSDMDDLVHKPVLMKEVIKALNIQSDGVYLDATFGRGGHSASILAALSDKGCLIALDKDSDAVEYGLKKFSHDPRFKILKSSFAKLKSALSEADLKQSFDGILFDLGVSSPQLDQAQRGFSFMRAGPLDMRMDQEQSLSAQTWLANAEQYEIRNTLKQLGEERFASRIARAIVEQREDEPITTTDQLAKLVSNAVPMREKDKHPATRTFQAIRIRINQELEEIKQALPQALACLKPGGRLVVISFHSLEDRIVKRFMRNQAKGDDFPLDLAVTVDMLNPRLKLVSKAIKPTAQEVYQNPRSRSSVLRVAQKIEALR